MAQPSVASFFNTRKRAAVEDAATIKNRKLIEPSGPSSEVTLNNPPPPTSLQVESHGTHNMRTRSGRTVKRGGVQTKGAEVPPRKISKIEQTIKQQKLVQYIKKGPLSPRKKAPPTPQHIIMQNINEHTPSSNSDTTSAPLNTAFSSKQSATNIERGLKTPTKQIIKATTPLKASTANEFKALVRKELNFDEVKTKVSRSAKLQELKASLARINELEQTRKAQEDHNRRLKEGIFSPAKKATEGVQLQQFETIELEVLTSPAKTFKTPVKLPPATPDKNELMSPRHTHVSKRVLFSPAKLGSPSKLIVPPAYQRFMSLVETSTAGKLLLPYKYRHLIEIFKGLDSVCSMFYNRKECITFKKLKPAVQRILRKNFTEMHLAQIRHLYPEAFTFAQMKMRNYGSTSKADYFQLVITPIVGSAEKSERPRPQKVDEDNVLSSAQSNAMNPQMITERLKHFQSLLLQRVKDEHDKFLKSLDPPLIIPKEKVTRWHPDFDLENCPDIELGHLPQPPNVEKYSSARDILSTARNLFNCATPIERALERYEAKKVEEEKSKNAREVNANGDQDATPNLVVTTPASASTVSNEVSSNLLKGVPKSLLERIRAKQAAKALDAMTRRPSQDQEAVKYSRLPELARHLRNVFITERKGVLTVELVIKKIQNSFRTCLTAQEVESHLKLLSKELPAWVSLHEVRKTMYLKLNKDMDLTKVVEKLEAIANEKSK